MGNRNLGHRERKYGRPGEAGSLKPSGSGSRHGEILGGFERKLFMGMQ